MIKKRESSPAAAEGRTGRGPSPSHLPIEKRGREREREGAKLLRSERFIRKRGHQVAIMTSKGIAALDGEREALLLEEKLPTVRVR